MTRPAPWLTIAIASYGTRAFGLNLNALPSGAGWHYLVCIQGLEPTDLKAMQAQLLRQDVTVIAVAGKGVSRNRNAAIAMATGDLLLFADDDLTLLNHHYPALSAYFEAKPEVDFICGRLVDPDGNLRKRYSPAGTAATRFNTGKVGTPELAIRLSRVRDKALKFDERFGAGAPLPLGDEYIFLTDCLRAGLQGCHVDLTLAVHPADSSGTIDNAENFDTRKKVIQRALGPLSWPARLGFVLRHHARFTTWTSLLRFLLP